MAKNQFVSGSSSQESSREINLHKPINLQEPDPESMPKQPIAADLEEISSSSDGSGSDSDSNGSRSGAAPTVREDTVKRPNGDPRKVLFKRIWSEDDEIVILEGLAKYSSEKKSDPMADLDDFLNFIKKDLHINCTPVQLLYKIRSLRNKYKRNKSKGKDGEDRSFSKRHEQKAYELSKDVWGNEVGRSRMRRARGKAAAHKRGGGEGSTVAVVVREGEKTCGVEEGILRAWVELCGGDKEWKKLRVEDVERRCKELEEKLAQSRFVLNVLKAAERVTSPQST